MKKTIIPLLFFLIIQILSNAQDLKFKYDSINKEWYHNVRYDLDTARQDGSRVVALSEIANYYKKIQSEMGLVSTDWSKIVITLKIVR